MGNSLDVAPEDCDEASNVITWDQVHVNQVPDFLAPLNMHGCVEEARHSLMRWTELSGLLKQQEGTVPLIANSFCADSQDELVLFAFCKIF